MQCELRTLLYQRRTEERGTCQPAVPLLRYVRVVIDAPQPPRASQWIPDAMADGDVESN